MFDILLDLFTSGGRNLSFDELESCRNGWNEKKWTSHEDYSLYCQGRRRLIGFVGSLGANSQSFSSDSDEEEEDDEELGVDCRWNGRL